MAGGEQREPQRMKESVMSFKAVLRYLKCQRVEVIIGHQKFCLIEMETEGITPGDTVFVELGLTAAF